VSSSGPAQLRCALCDQTIGPGASYVVRIDVFADPEPLYLTSKQIEAVDLTATLSEVLQQIEHMSADELQDGVHRRIEYRLCPGCQRRYLANPLGMPRGVRIGSN